MKKIGQRWQRSVPLYREAYFQLLPNIWKHSKEKKEKTNFENWQLLMKSQLTVTKVEQDM